MNIQTWKIDRLRPDSRNARKHGKKNLATIRASLEQFGQRRAAVVRSDGTVLAGNGMLEAARSLGWTELAVSVVPDEWSDEQGRAYALADNRTGELAEWDVAVLDEHLVELEVAGLDIESLGFEKPEPTTDIVEDDIPEPPDEPTTRLGDVWQLGNHIIGCGSSEDSALVDKVVAGRNLDMVWTDPPYGVAYVGGGRAAAYGQERDAIANDDLSHEQLRELLSSVLGLAYAHCRAGASWFVCATGGPKMLEFASVLHELGVWRQSLVWVKDIHVMGRSDYHGRHEPIFYGWVPGAAHTEPPDRKQNTVWEFPRPRASKQHPTMKPLELIDKSIRNHTKPGALVYDPFMGSGSTLIACEMSGRAAVGIELEPKYVDVIIARWEELTGEKAVLANG